MKKARVLLLNPPTAAPAREVLLGLAYVAAVLRKQGHEVKLVDATAPYKPVAAREIKKLVADFQPLFIGISLTLTNIPQTYLFIKDLKGMGVPVVAGGPQATNCPREALENGTDFVVIGEGETTASELTQYLLGEREIRDVAGLSFREDAKAVYTQPRALIDNLDTIPFPDFTDFPIRNYTGSDDPDSNPMFWSIFTSRGCPFDCTFCSSHNVFGKAVRFRSAANVFEEIKGLIDRFGVKTITFQDDEILCLKKRVLELCNLIINARLKLKMSIRTRIDSIDKELLLKMKEAGITRITFGIESWNDETLARINKKYKVIDIHKKFKAIEEAGFPYVSFNNICGFPWETKSHFKANLKEISKMPASIRYFTNIGIIAPYPRTRLYDEYHRRFDFTDWWLDSGKNRLRAVFRDEERPFFLEFAGTFYTLYRPEIFWHYSRRMSKDIERLSWGLFMLFIRRHFGFLKSVSIFFLCRLSHFIWRRSPALELRIFRLFRRTKIRKSGEKLFFNSKY